RQALSPPRVPTRATLATPVRFLKGIGPSRSGCLERLGVRTVRDALLLTPRRYEDRRALLPIGRLRLGEFQTVAGRVKAIGLGRTRRGVPYCEVMLEDGTGTLLARWYRQPYLTRTFRRGQRVILAGRVSPYPPREMVNPEHEIEEGSDARYHTGRIVPIYPLTAGLSQRFLRRWLADLSREHAPGIPDPLPPAVQERHRLLRLAQAVQSLHLPGEMTEASAARRRLAFDEFFLFSLAILRQRAVRTAEAGIAFRVPNALAERARALLPFALTPAQVRALEAIWNDMAQARPMQRLLQGDVGCGKTIVAVLAALTAIGSGYQAAIMAPTEILAAQHAERARVLVEPLGVPVVHLAGGTTESLRRQALELLAGESPCLAVGTHALLQPDVVFGRLGFVVVDEQHRFGVLQRAGLQKKAVHPDVLVMTATPIPRSLALVLYGDLDLCVIDELPPGRRPVSTLWVEEAERSRIQAELRTRLARGERAYVVCPVVEESAAALKAAVQTADACISSADGWDGRTSLRSASWSPIPRRSPKRPGPGWRPWCVNPMGSPWPRPTCGCADRGNSSARDSPAWMGLPWETSRRISACSRRPGPKRRQPWRRRRRWRENGRGSGGRWRSAGPHAWAWHTLDNGNWATWQLGDWARTQLPNCQIA
ncbi:MAG: ATP-dependent DNA helicase RecG, partial [candidate division NC10 bacterium]|nr:ATP-dependent DNA helicase RecG [candidate division NC10 bacterium]